MLRLWPEILHIGLFPGLCYLESRQLRVQQSFDFEHATAMQTILQVLDTLLSDHHETIARLKRVSLTVSDRFGASVLLPWRDELKQANEIGNFARLCFEMHHLNVGQNDVMRTEFLRFRKNGIAYAFTPAWLDQLQAILGEHNLAIKRILPISASVFFKNQVKNTKVKKLVMLSEKSHITGLLFDKNNFVSMEVEPLINSSEISCGRLLRRMAAIHDNINLIQICSPEMNSALSSEIKDRDFSYLSNIAPTAKIEEVNREQWHN